MMADARELQLLVVAVLLAGVWSWVGAYDSAVWWLESLPVWIALLILGVTYRQFPLTRLAYWLVFCHAVVLLVGAHYTYSRVPLGNWLAEALDLKRNHYDRFAHVVQGFVPAIIAREILIRHAVVRSPRWLFFLVVSFCLGFSAFYELIEWQSVIWGGDGSTEFLGTQGDIWDAQWDMALALSGAILAQLLLARRHDRQIGAVATGYPRWLTGVK